MFEHIVVDDVVGWSPSNLSGSILPSLGVVGLYDGLDEHDVGLVDDLVHVFGPLDVEASAFDLFDEIVVGHVGESSWMSSAMSPSECVEQLRQGS